MKKSVLLGVLFAGLSTLTLAQSEKHIWDLRLYGGMNILQLTSDANTATFGGILHDRSVSGRPGFQLGGAVSFGNRFYVKPGVQFTTISTKIVNKNTITGNELTDEASIGLISVPLRVGLRLIDPRNENFFNVRLYGGITGTHVMKINQKTNSPDTPDLKLEDYQNLIMNADLGLGVDIWFLYLDLGYQLGLSPVHRGGDNAKANAFYGNLGIRFTFGK